MLVLSPAGFLLEIYCIRFFTRSSKIVATGFRMMHDISDFTITNGCKNGCKIKYDKKKGLGWLPNPLILLERETGFEPATFSLGS